jgi:surfeit locus 1 family protein
MLGLHALAVVALAAAVVLGLWQYGVWQHHRADQSAALVHAAPKPLDSVLTADEAFPNGAVGRPVRLTGRWLPGSTLYVAGRVHHGRHGVWAVTPVAVCRSDASCGRAPAVLVVRGWAASVRDAPAPPSGPVRVTGWLQPGESADVVDPHPGDDVLPQLQVAAAVQHVPRDLYGGYVIAKTVVSTGSTTRGDGSTTRGDGSTSRGEGGSALAPVRPPSPPKPTVFTSVRNFLYALEWWVFGGFAVYLWWRWCRDEVARVTRVPSNA